MCSKFDKANMVMPKSRDTKNYYGQGCHSYVQSRKLRPQNPYLGSQQILREKLANSPGLYQADFKSHFGCVNAIEFSNNGGTMIASGGDDRRVLLWNTQKAMWNKGSPACMKSEHRSNIFCVAFDKDNEKIFSGGNDEQVFVHDAATGNPVDNFMHEDAVYGLSVDPNNSHVFASACDDGRILIYDIREPADSEPFCLANYVSSMHSVMYNPVEPRLLATANAREGIGLWDVRKPKSCLLRYGGEYEQQSCMSVRINGLGNQVLALRRRLPPVIYNIDSPSPVVEFDHSGYFNSCTMKSCCFAGDKDQYILSGSDDFNVYMWAIPSDLSERQYINSAHLILKGHRSIVNQVRFNKNNGLIISSGVEKTIKAWSAFPLHEKNIKKQKKYEMVGGERTVYTHEEYINLMLRAGHVMSHDYSQQSTDEDPRMMAFFDSLVQREMETWSSSEEFSSNEEELYDRILQVARDPQDPVNPLIAEELNNSDNSNDDYSPFTLAFASVMASRTDQELNNRLLNFEDSSDDDTNEHADTGTTANRRSISDIIAENKKEILVRSAEAKKKLKASRTRQTLKRELVSSDTDSDSDSEDECPAKFSKTSDELGESSSANTNKKLPNLDTKHSKVKFQLKKLRELRSHVLNSDSDSNDHSQSESNDKNSSEQTASSSFKDTSGEYGPFLHKPGESLIPHFRKSSENINNNVNHNDIDRKVSCNDRKVDSSMEETISHPTNAKQTDNTASVVSISDDHRPGLNKTISDDLNSGSSMSSNLNLIGSFTSKPSTSQINDNDNVINMISKSNQQKSDTMSTVPLSNFKNDTNCLSDTCDDSVKQKQTSSGNNFCTLNASVQPKNNTTLDDNNSTKCDSVIQGGSNSHNLDNIDREPTWNEFKRYKRTLERATRYYRRQSSSQPSSEEDI